VTVGSTLQLTATPRDKTAATVAGTTITWASSNTGVATVNSSGRVSGVAPGTVTITAVSPNGKRGSVLVTVGSTTVTITTTSLLSATQNVPYQRALNVSGGTGSYSWSIVSGSLPTGLSLSSTTGVISGTPSTVQTSQFTVQVTSGGATDTQALTLSVQAPGAEPTPDLLEDFSTYTSTSNMISDPRGIYTSEDVNTSWIALDTNVGYGSSDRSMRFDYPGRSAPCSAYTIGRNMDLGGDQTEVWIELVLRWENGFHTSPSYLGSCTSGYNPDHKTFFGRTHDSRFEIKVGQGPGQQFSGGYPGNETAFQSWGASPDEIVWDGQPHVFRIHWKIGTGGKGIVQIAIDGTTYIDRTSLSMVNTALYGLALGRNWDGPSDSDQSLWWHKIAVWYNNPGWTF
jgi:hypothetical protein